ncbi:hypothetical protein [Caldisalinibacter kiritimatiensis]|uniref:Uncharacterized protein n=1 Tax=Caldisalinibacter kiritimatiensis TaxID=1304284 RepID=R1CGK6_9FIRM|nr:hypothetical protein [Caldisalinibacter kiritimatiensis]EOD01430.1 hypothetical protein L21TH_0477 [Caldisalinibacter kiritimatiensis]
MSNNDFLSDRKTEVVKIDNIAPVTSLDIIKRKPIDMLFFEDEKELQNTISATDLLKEELNNRTDIIVDVNQDVIDVDMSNEPVTVLDETKSPW